MIELWGRSYDAGSLRRRLGRLDQLAGMQLLEATDGPARGSRILRCDTGSGFSFEILVDRGFDIGRAWHSGRPLAWWSPVGLLSPALVDTSGIEWFRGFAGGLVSTCGLDHTLLGGEDDASHFAYPHRRREAYGLHGRYTALPARLIGAGETWVGERCELWAEGEVRQVAVFGEQLFLRRRISADLGGTTVRLHDRVENIGATPVTHMQLYHCNIGFPIVDAGSQLVYPAPDGECVSDASTVDYRTLTGPAATFVEECYEHDMVAIDGVVEAGVVNPDLGLGIVQRYRRDELPHHITWRQLGEGTYVVAMEPSTNRDAGRFDARERGELILLEPGETREYHLELEVLPEADAVDAFVGATAGRVQRSRDGAGVEVGWRRRDR